MKEYEYPLESLVILLDYCLDWIRMNTHNQKVFTGPISIISNQFYKNQIRIL